MNFSKVKLEVYLPRETVEPLRDALTEIGACQVGKYDNVVSFFNIQGCWRPLPGSNPFEGECGVLHTGTECKLELRCPFEKVGEAVAVIRKIHPYEEPVINVVPLLNDLFQME